MLKQVIEHMKRKVNGTLLPPQKKLYLYSGHENNVINILAALNLFKPHVPKYSAGVVIELHYLPDVNTHAVKVSIFDILFCKTQIVFVKQIKVLLKKMFFEQTCICHIKI